MTLGLQAYCIAPPGYKFWKLFFAEIKTLLKNMFMPVCLWNVKNVKKNNTYLKKI